LILVGLWCLKQIEAHNALIHRDILIRIMEVGIEVTHSGALDCGNMDEDVLSAVGRLNEAKTPL
jgi:hypothetical protein